HPVDGAEEGRFAAAGRPDERGDALGRNVERDAVQRLERAVVEVEVAHGDLHGRFILSRRRTARRATIDSDRIIITSSSAPAHACRCQSSYGEIAYVNTCTVSEAIGCTRLVDQ